MAHIKERDGEDAERLGKLDVAAQLRIVDQSRRVRGEIQQFDFDLARLKTEETKKELESNPQLLEQLRPDKRAIAEFYLNMDAEWTKRMHKVIDYTFEETEIDSDPNYSKALIVVFGILGFVIFQGLRLRNRSIG